MVDTGVIAGRACPLTASERGVLGAARGGGSAVEIAVATNLALDAVREHLCSATTKLGVRTRDQAIRLAATHGWI